MAKKKEKKRFILDSISKYFKNPEICGYDKKLKRCSYKTEDGRMCVAGQYMPDVTKISSHSLASISWLITRNGYDVFSPEHRKQCELLSPIEWRYLQLLHDELVNLSYSKTDPEVTRAIHNLEGYTEIKLPELYELTKKL